MGLTPFIHQVRLQDGDVDLAVAERLFGLYQQTFPRIVELRSALFREFHTACVTGDGVVSSLRIQRFSEADSRPSVRIVLPTGRALYYRDLVEANRGLWHAPQLCCSPAVKVDPRERQHRPADGTVRAQVTPQVLIENVVQAIARDILMHQALVLEDADLAHAFAVHDELVHRCGPCRCTSLDGRHALGWFQPLHELVPELRVCPAFAPPAQGIQSVAGSTDNKKASGDAGFGRVGHDGLEPSASGLRVGDPRSSGGRSPSQPCGKVQITTRPDVQTSQRFAAIRSPLVTPLLQAAAMGAAASKRDSRLGTRLLTVKEAAKALRVSTATVYAMVGRGELEHVRVSNAIRICVRAPEERAR